MYIEVKFKKTHNKFAYFPGDTGVVRAKYIFDLLLDGVVKVLLVKTLRSGFKSVFKWLKSNKKFEDT